MCASVCALNDTCWFWSPLLADSRFSPYEGQEEPALQQYAPYGDFYHARVCLCTSSITSLIFSAINPLAALLLMCILRGYNVSCGEDLTTAPVSNQVTTWTQGGCLCVCAFVLFYFVDLSFPLPQAVATDQSICIEGVTLTAGGCMRTQD